MDVLGYAMNLEKEATQVTESVLVSEDANNALNVYRGSIDVVSSQLLDNTNGGSNTAWYLMTNTRTL